MKILMVCLGNICRSPLAHGILQNRIDTHKLNWTVDSAGTNGYHNGESPDPRSIAEGLKNDIDIRDQRSRQIILDDIKHFNLIIAMDVSNYNNILKMCSPDEHSKIKMIMNYSHPGRNINVPDPYYHNGFDKVFKMLEGAIDQLVQNNI